MSTPRPNSCSDGLSRIGGMVWAILLEGMNNVEF